MTSGSLIKWIWFLRGNSRLLSPGASPTEREDWCVVMCVCERESVSMYSIAGSVCVYVFVCVCAVWCIKQRGSG